MLSFDLLKFRKALSLKNSNSNIFYITFILCQVTNTWHLVGIKVIATSAGSTWQLSYSYYFLIFGFIGIIKFTPLMSDKECVLIV